MRLVAAFTLITLLHVDIVANQLLNELTRKKTSNDLAKAQEDVHKQCVKVFKSCKEILDSHSNNNGNGIYTISDGKNGEMKVYCQMSSVSGCSGGGWTMVMKIDGSQSTFRYNSGHWTSTSTYNDNHYGRNGGLDHREFKGQTYWKTPIKEICVAMKHGGQLKAFSFSCPASSLYDLIADGSYRRTYIGRSQWKQLIHGSSLQHNCNREGFNVYSGANRFTRVRLGLVTNNEHTCHSPDSFIGLGAEGGVYQAFQACEGRQHSLNTAGNLAQCSPDNGVKNLKAMGYILVR